MDITAKLYDVFVRDPVSFWTGKEPEEVRPFDAIPVYAAAAFPYAAVVLAAGCDGYEGEQGDVADTDTYVGTDTEVGDECVEGETDYSYSGPAETQGVGICQDRIEVCMGGFWQTIQHEQLPYDEVDQNGVDDDCDGLVDEVCATGDVQQWYSGPDGSLDVGICQGQIEVCTNGLWQTIQHEVLPQGEVHGNGLDDDCDGYVDEACEEGEGQQWYSGPAETHGVGVCQDQMEVCSGGLWQVTQEQVLPAEEVEGNGLDDDCDGFEDEVCEEGQYQQWYAGPAWTANVGICQNQAEVCTDGAWQMVQEQVLPEEESEDNGLDDDCDGATDECPEGETLNTYSGPAETQGLGICQDHIETCVDGEWELMQEEVLPIVENYFNETDDDCDGYADEIDLSGVTLLLMLSSIQPDFIRLREGATLRFIGTDVEIETDSIEIDAASKLELIPQAEGSGEGNVGNGFYDGGGGGGGSHIGIGGDGGDGGWQGLAGSSGAAYGSAEDFVAEPGSAGGEGGGPYGASGGWGGGALTLIAGLADIFGTISVAGRQGNNAPYDDGGCGGGSGGTLLFEIGALTVSTTSTLFSARGGDGGGGGPLYIGGGGGGGGGGGSIEFAFDEATIDGVGTYYPAAFATFRNLMLSNGCFDVSGGEGGEGGNEGFPGESGQPGAVNSSMP